jgi:hypothetical protein
MRVTWRRAAVVLAGLAFGVWFYGYVWWAFAK